MSQQRILKCPGCGDHLEVEDEIRVGTLAYCVECDEELKVISVDPLKLRRMVEILEVYNEDRQNGFMDEDTDEFYKEEDA